MIDNTWTCRERLLANINPDGGMQAGCYVRDRGEVACSQCGFTPVAEASGAYALLPGRSWRACASSSPGRQDAQHLSNRSTWYSHGPRST